MDKTHRLEEMPFFVGFQEDGRAIIDVAVFEQWAESTLEEPNEETLMALEDARAGRTTTTSLEQLSKDWETARCER